MPFYPNLRNEILEKSAYQDKQAKLNHIAQKLLDLKKALQVIPAKSRKDKLLLATFNIREFDSNDKKYGPRTTESFYYLAEIISSFDIVALQEINEDLSGLRRLMKIIGYDYNYFITDITEGRAGNKERMAYIYDQKKIRFNNLAGEIVLPSSIKSPSTQFSRTPYLVGFQAGWFKFNLCTVHIYFGANSGEAFERRVKEIEDISLFFEKRSKREAENFILLGDFNIPKHTSKAMEALLKGGFQIPESLQKLPGSNLKQDKFYDQIAFLEGKNKIKFSGNAGVFDFYKTIYKREEKELYFEDFKILMEKNGKPCTEEIFEKEFDTWRTFQMSDHLPLWVELDIDYSEEYLLDMLIK